MPACSSACSATDDEREPTLEGLRSAHGVLQRRVAGELRLKHTPTLEFVYDDTADRAMRARADPSPTRRARVERRAARGRSCASSRDCETLRARHPREPRRRRARLARRPCRGSCARWARTRSCSWPPTSSRCPTSTASSTSTGWSPRRRRTSTSRTIVFLDCGNIDRNPVERAQARRRAHPQRRPPPRQHPLRHDQPRRAGGVVHGGDRVGPDARPRRRADAPVAEALYVGLVTDTGRFMYENTGARAHVMAAELIEAGVDVHGHLPAPVRGHARAPSSSCWRAR